MSPTSCAARRRRRTRFRGRIAFKTGTSYGFRDALAVGFDRLTTIAVWVGRPDNGPTPGLIGRQAAAPILFDAFARLGRDVEIDPAAEGRAARAATADLPPPLRHLRKDAPKTMAATETAALKIAYPPDGARVDLGIADGARDARLALKALGGAPPFAWFVNGAPVGEAELAPQLRLEARRRGLRPRHGGRRQGRVGRGDGEAGVNPSPEGRGVLGAGLVSRARTSSDSGRRPSDGRAGSAVPGGRRTPLVRPARNYRSRD